MAKKVDVDKTIISFQEGVPVALTFQRWEKIKVRDEDRLILCGVEAIGGLPMRFWTSAQLIRNQDVFQQGKTYIILNKGLQKGKRGRFYSYDIIELEDGEVEALKQGKTTAEQILKSLS